jgi:hypothetical protein
MLKAVTKNRVYAEMRCCEFSKEMSSLYFGLDVFCQFEARVPEFDHCSVYRVYVQYGGGWLRVKF